MATAVTESKRCLPLGRKADKSRWHIKKQKHHFADQGLYSQSYSFPVVMYGRETWTIKKLSNCDTEEDLRASWTAKRSNQSILKEVNPEYSVEGMMLKLKLQHFGHMMRRANSPESSEDWGQEEKRLTENEMTGWHHQFNGHEFEQTPGDTVKDREACTLQTMRLQRVRHNWFQQ